MKQHYVTFYSPGTFVDEETRIPIESWDVDAAVKLSAGVTERYNAKPHSFVFSTRERGPDDLDASITERSGTYFLGGQVWTLADLVERDDPKDRILIANMQANDWAKAVHIDNSYPVWKPLLDGDTVLDLAEVPA